MKFDTVSQPAKRPDADLVVLPFWEGPQPAASLTPWEGAIGPFLALGDFKGKQGETALIATSGKEPRILLLGLGKPEAVTVESLRRSAAAAVKGKGRQRINWVFPEFRSIPIEASLRGFVEGLLFSNYRFTQFKKGEEATQRVTFLGIGEKVGDLIDRLQKVHESVSWACDLVNGNADEITPHKLVLAATEMENGRDLKTTVFDREKLEAKGFGLILAVGRAAREAPYLIQVDYKGDPKSRERAVLVGKGVTYDTGGLSLKPTDSMLTMKCDMAGGAAVLGAIRAIADLGLKVNVTALVPTAENAIGSGSYKLGDVYRGYSGKTVEINNTDAEGRLLLADALSYAVQELDPSCLIDCATLTGSAVMALGEDMAALFSSDERLTRELIAAGEISGELLWRLPIWNEYFSSFKSETADLLNSGGREAGAIKAALFLQEFVGKTPWAHLDIAGPAFICKPKHYYPTKATGFGVRLLVELFARKGQA